MANIEDKKDKEKIYIIARFAKDSGKILGAEVIGNIGVDKRLDVLSTAITAGMTYDDLIDLSLVYSPPFSLAKDVINRLGSVAKKQIEGK